MESGKRITVRAVPSQQSRKSKKKPKAPKGKTVDIVNEFLTAYGRITFHYGEVFSRKFVGKNKIKETGVWHADTFRADETGEGYEIPYTLIATMGAPRERKYQTKLATGKDGAR